MIGATRMGGGERLTVGLDREFSQVAMKRSQAPTTPTPSSPARKKVKMSPNPFEVLVDDTEDGWTKVEKRKAKKAKKVVAKIDVCFLFMFSLMPIVS